MYPEPRVVRLTPASPYDRVQSIQRPGSREWRADQVPGKGISFRGTVEDAYTILADISSALAYLASKGIMHNDIRASNILYSGRGVPGGAILIDFGLSRRVDEDPEDRGGGTPWYIAPEYPAYTRESSADIWSLGIVMLYVMRRVHFRDRTIWNMYDEVRGVPKAVAMRQAWNKRIQASARSLRGQPRAPRRTSYESSSAVWWSRGSSASGRMRWRRQRRNGHPSV